jgi:hypothetical protein
MGGWHVERCKRRLDEMATTSDDNTTPHFIARSLHYCTEHHYTVELFSAFSNYPLPSSHVDKSEGMSFMYIVVRYHELMMEAESRLKPSQTIKEKTTKKKNAKRLYPDFQPFSLPEPCML